MTHWNANVESLDHFRLKANLLRAATAAGWKTTREARLPDGSRADVLAEFGGRRIALEAQVTHQSPREYRARIKRYEAMGIDSYWFSPGKHSRGRSRLPVLQVRWVPDEGRWAVLGEDRTVECGPMVHYPLDEVVGDLLSGALRLYSAPSPVFPLIDILSYGCWRCPATFAVWACDREAHICQRCGWDLELSADHQLFPQQRPEGALEVVELVEGWARTHHAGLAAITPSYSHTARGTYDAFNCNKCHALIGDWFVRSAFLEARIDDAITDRIALPCNEDQVFPLHWCLDSEAETRASVLRNPLCERHRNAGHRSALHVSHIR